MTTFTKCVAHIAGIRLRALLAVGSAAVSVGCAVAAASGAGPQANAATSGLAGKWSINIGTPTSPEPRSLEATVASDGSIHGTLGSPNGAVPVETGQITGNRFRLTATLGTGLLLTYEGVVVRDTIRGTWRYDNHDGVFVGRRGDVLPHADPIKPPASGDRS